MFRLIVNHLQKCVSRHARDGSRRGTGKGRAAGLAALLFASFSAGGILFGAPPPVFAASGPSASGEAASDPEGELDWISWEPGSGDAVDLVLSSMFAAETPIVYAIVDFDADGVGEIVAGGSECDGEGDCTYDVLRYTGKEWINDFSFRSEDPRFEVIRDGDIRRYGIRAGDIVWYLTGDGFAPAAPPAANEIEARPPNAGEIDLLADFTNPNTGVPRSDLWADVYERDLNGDGRPDRILMVRTPALCAQGGMCPFHVVEQDGRLIASGVTYDEPLLLKKADGATALIATVPAGFLFHDIAYAGKPGEGRTSAGEVETFEPLR